jgi:hypothetical protein
MEHLNNDFLSCFIKTPVIDMQQGNEYIMYRSDNILFPMRVRFLYHHPDYIGQYIYIDVLDVPKNTTIKNCAQIFIQKNMMYSTRDCLFVNKKHMVLVTDRVHKVQTLSSLALYQLYSNDITIANFHGIIVTRRPSQTSISCPTGL